MSQRTKARHNELNGSQMFSQSSSQTRSQISDDELKILSDKCLRYMLNASHNWSTIKRQDIIKHALDGKTRVFTKVLEHLEMDFREIYGYKIVEIDPEKPNAQQQYFLVRDCDEPYTNGLILSDEQKYQVILRYIILVHLHLSGGSCTNDSLSSFLKKMDITMDDTQHKYFGDIKKRIAELAKQNYITATNTLNTDDSVVYNFGSRALQEYNTEDFERFANEILTNFRVSVENEMNQEE